MSVFIRVSCTFICSRLDTGTEAEEGHFRAVFGIARRWRSCLVGFRTEKSC